MATITQLALQVAGLGVNGDVGPFTCYTKSGKGTVVYTRAPPRVPFSIPQLANRETWKGIGWLWSHLDAATKAQWKLARDRARLSCTPFNLFLHFQTRLDYDFLKCLERRTGTQLQ